jgi:hypothetical protein
MDATKTPLTILIGSDKEAVLYQNSIVAGLTHFQLCLGEIVETAFYCANCFPRVSGHRAALADYPLHIHVGDDINDAVVAYNGRPIGFVKEAFLSLSADAKRIIRLTSYVPWPDDLKPDLLELGVELIEEAPDADL